MEILLLIIIFTYPILLMALGLLIAYIIVLRKKLKTREKMNNLEENFK